MAQEYTSKGTSIRTGKVPKLFTIVGKKFGWEKGTLNFDLGGGKYDDATKWLKKRGVDNLVYDPYNRDPAHNPHVLDVLKGRGDADTATLSNVLNVIKEDVKKIKALRTAHRNLKDGGVCYITCYQSPRRGESRKDSWQEARPLDDYLPMVLEVFGNVEKKYGLLMAVK